MGSRAEQVMNGAIRIVAILSRLFSMVRVAMIAGTAQAYADNRGMNAFPFSPRPASSGPRSAPRAPDSRNLPAVL